MGHFRRRIRNCVTRDAGGRCPRCLWRRCDVSGASVRKHLPSVECFLALPPPKQLLDVAGAGLHVLARRTTHLDLRPPRFACACSYHFRCGPHLLPPRNSFDRRIGAHASRPADAGHTPIWVPRFSSPRHLGPLYLLLHGCSLGHGSGAFRSLSSARHPGLCFRKLGLSSGSGLTCDPGKKRLESGLLESIWRLCCVHVLALVCTLSSDERRVSRWGSRQSPYHGDLCVVRDRRYCRAPDYSSRSEERRVGKECR